MPTQGHLSDEAIQGVEFDSPTQMEEWEQNNPNLTPVMRNLVRGWVKTWQADVAEKHVASLENTVRQGHIPVHARLEKLIEDGRAATAKLNKAFRGGRVEVYRKAERDLASLRRQFNECVKMLTALEESNARWEEDADADPMDRVEEMRRRFPSAARNTKVRVTVAMLKGEEPGPFGPGR
jgi:hypothetical protein